MQTQNEDTCDYCRKPVDPHDNSVYHQIVGWVHGSKRDSLCMRQDTGKLACEMCIRKLKLGQSPDQQSLFD